MSLVSTPAILLRSHPYSESSRILRFYSEGLGVVGVLARGVRRSGGRSGGGLSTFTQGVLTLYHRENRELQTLKEFAPTHSHRGLSLHPFRLAAASVLAELVLQHAEGEGSPTLFHELAGSLGAVETEEEGTLLVRLLMELWKLVRVLGYEPELEVCVACGLPLDPSAIHRFDLSQGGIRCPACQEGSRGPRLGPKAREQLRGLLRGRLDEALLRPRAHLRLVSDFVTYHISGGTPLRSMEVLSTLLPETHA